MRSSCNTFCYKTALLYMSSFENCLTLELLTLLKCYIIELPKERKRLKSSCSETSFSFNQPFLRAHSSLSPKERKRLKALQLNFIFMIVLSLQNTLQLLHMREHFQELLLPLLTALLLFCSLKELLLSISPNISHSYPITHL